MLRVEETLTLDSWKERRRKYGEKGKERRE